MYSLITSLFLLISLNSFSQVVKSVDGSDVVISKGSLKLLQGRTYSFLKKDGSQADLKALKGSDGNILMKSINGTLVVGDELTLKNKTSLKEEILDSTYTPPSASELEKRRRSRKNRVYVGLTGLSQSDLDGSDVEINYERAMGFGLHFGYNRHFGSMFRFVSDISLTSGGDLDWIEATGTIKFQSSIRSEFLIGIGILPVENFGIDFLVGVSTNSLTGSGLADGSLSGLSYGVALSYEHYFNNKFGIRPSMRYLKQSFSSIEINNVTFTFADSLSGSSFGGAIDAVWNF